MKWNILMWPARVLFFLLAVLTTVAHAEQKDTSLAGYNKQYTFTKNWFTHKIPSWTQALKELKGKPDIRYLEVGTFEGRSALWVLENILTHPSAEMIIIDAFEENTYKIFTSNVKLSGDAKKVKILSGPSTDKTKELPSNSIDFAYIDGSGKGIVMLSDLVSTWNLLKLGGIIICSRYALDGYLRVELEMQPGDPGPIEAIDTFVNMYKPYIRILLSEENQVIIQKIRR
jgi:predicted O-methyltransferase YrrM